MSNLVLIVRADSNDPDPLPRRAPVGPGSAFAAVAAAPLVAAGDVRVESGEAAKVRRRLRPVTAWRFRAEPGDKAVERDVEVPHVWSRAEPELIDWRGPCEYATTLESAAQRAELVCTSLDYLATVLLDGNAVATHEGGFSPVAVELPTGRPIDVRLVLDDPVEEALVDTGEPIMLAKRKIKGVHEWHDSRPGGMQLGAGYHEHWIWRWGSGGISRPVVLHESGVVRLDAVFATPGEGSLALSFVVHNGGPSIPIELVAVIDGQRVVVACQAPSGPGRVAVVLDCAGARRWSPADPYLYELTAEVVAEGDISDALTIPVGFRSVALELSERQPFELRLDGLRHYLRAANYVAGAWPGEVSDAIFERDIELARAANLNSLGVHAGVWPELLPFADRGGILIYQDFPLQWSYDPGAGPLREGGSSFAEASAHLTAELVYLLYNHPSIVYWCAHNEPAYQLLEAFAASGTPELQPFVDALQQVPDERPADEARVELFRRLDPTRPAFPASGLGASRPVGDVHNYTGSLAGGSATDAPTGTTAFVSEYGAWFANFSAADDDHDWHEQTHLLDVQDSYAGRRQRYEDFPTWCFAGQLWGGWHAKIVTEKARLTRFAPSSGHRYHFFVDHFGHGGAGLVDQFRTTGPAYRAYAQANRPLLALAPTPQGCRVTPGEELRLPIVVVNDLHEQRHGLELRWWVAALEGDDAFLVGRDTPTPPGTLASIGSPVDQVAVVPRRPGRTLLEGTTTRLDLDGDTSLVADEMVFTPESGALALFLELDGVLSWTSFVAERDGWSPPPGLTGPRRFQVTMDRPAPLVRRWSGEEVDPTAAPPDQYLVGTVPVDVFDDTHVRADGHVESPSLPWADPLAAR